MSDEKISKASGVFTPIVIALNKGIFMPLNSKPHNREIKEG